MRNALLILLLLAGAAFGQTTINDRLNMDPASLDDPDNVYVLVDDTNKNPIQTRKLDLASIKNLASDKLTLTADTVLTGQESPFLVVEVDTVDDELTLAAGQNIWVTNSKTSNAMLVVNGVGVQGDLHPSYSAWFRWNGSAHEITYTGAEVDVLMSDTSNNPVRNSTVKAYIDGQVAGGFVTQAEHDAEALVRPYDFVIDETSDIATAAAAATVQGYGTLWISGAVLWNVNVTIPAAVNLRGLDSTATIIVDTPGGLQIGDSTQPLGSTWGSHSGDEITNFMPDGDWLDELSTDEHRRNRFIAPTLTGVEEGDWVAIFCDTDLRRNASHVTNNLAPMPYEIHRVHRIFTSGPDTVYEIDGAVSEPMVPLAFTYTVDDTTETFTAAGHNLANDDRVKFRGISPAPRLLFTDEGLPANLDPDVEYWVINVAGDDFQVSLTQGGGAVDIGDTGTAGQEQLVHNMGFPAMVWELPIETTNGGGNGSKVIMDNLTFVSPANQQEAFVNFKLLDGVEITNCRWDFATGDGAPARMSFDHCTNVQIHHNVVEANGDLPVDDIADWLWVGRVNGFNVHDNYVANVRHAVLTVTDQRTIQGVGRRPGSTLNLRIHRNHFMQDVLWSTGSAVQSAAIMLAENGYQVRVDGNTFDLRTESAAAAVGVRSHSRETQIINNRFRGHPFGVGVLLYAGNQLVEENEFRDVASCIGVFGSLVASGPQAFYGNVARNNKIYRSTGGNAIGLFEGEYFRGIANEFYDCTSRVYRIAAGGNHTLANNLVADQAAPSTPDSLVDIDGTTGPVTLTGNRFVNCNTGGSIIDLDGIDDVFIDSSTFINCTCTSLIQTLNDCNTIAITSNTAQASALHTNFLNAGTTVVAADLEISGNNLRGYGSGAIGVTGTDSANITTAFADDNWVDD